MKIDSAYVGMDSERTFTSYALDTVTGNIKSKGTAQGWDTGGYSFAQLLEFAGEGKEEFANRTSGTDRGFHTQLSNVAVKAGPAAERNIVSIRQSCIMFLIRWLCGINAYRRIIQGEKTAGYSDDLQGYDMIRSLSGSNMPSYGSYYNEEHFRAEAEDTGYQARGCVRTSDGRQIDFNLSLYMSRRMCQYAGVQRASDLPALTDPLVINIDAPVAGVSDQKFMFDIDADGTEDEISSLEKGSGFLALDKNGDGCINDGSELFGTESGDGFYDLSEYDGDGNGWIDENDDVFNRLKVWCRDENGKDILYTLKDAGVGAICLQNVPTDFSLNSLSDNKTNARIRSTGIFLYENGGVGTINHLDLAR